MARLESRAICCSDSAFAAWGARFPIGWFRCIDLADAGWSRCPEFGILSRTGRAARRATRHGIAAYFSGAIPDCVARVGGGGGYWRRYTYRSFVDAVVFAAARFQRGAATVPGSCGLERHHRGIYCLCGGIVWRNFADYLHDGPPTV